MKFKLMNGKQFTALCAELGEAVTSLRGKVQVAAVTAVGYSIVHGDVGAANRLIDAVGSAKTIRRDSLVAFLEKFGALAWSKGEKKFLYFRREDVEFDDDYVALMEANPWFGVVKEPEIASTLEVDVEVDKFLKRLRKLASEPKVDVKDRQLIAAIEEAQARYNARKYLGDAAVNAVLTPDGSVMDPKHGEVIIPSLKDASQLAANQ